jgi:two-component sensor histidine kinase
LQNVRNREIEFITNIRLAEETTLAAQLSEEEAKDKLLDSLFLSLFFGIVTILSIGVGLYLYKQGKLLKEKDQFLQVAYRREIDLNHLLKEVYSESIHRIRNYFSILGATINKELRTRKKAVKYSNNEQDFLSHLQQKIFIFRNINEALGGISTQNLEILTINVISILKTLQSDFQLNYPKIKFECTFIEYLEIDYRTVEIICLIVHEAIINATKHAFDEDRTNAVIGLKLTVESNNNIYLSIRDNGKGITEEFKKNGGLKRIKTFVTLLNGTFTFHNKAEGGTEMIIRFVIKNR